MLEGPLVPGDTTLPPTADGAAPPSAERTALGVLVLWANDPALQAGQLILADAPEVWVGRNTEGFVLQRPGENAAAPGITSPRFSRRQLRMMPRSGAIAIENVGKVPLVVAGRETPRAVVTAGDVVSIGRELLLLVVERPASMRAYRAFAPRHLGRFGGPDAFGIVGESPRAHRLRDALAFASSAPGHALLIGPSGSGKELAARAIHAMSPAAQGPFVARNAATLPPGLVDSELFGSARNYPNAGMPERAGLVGEADGGTLFIDEIGELPLDAQAHLLRLMDDGEYHRLGEGRARTARVRVVGATNREVGALKPDVAARFILRIETPALAERREDIPLVAAELVARIRARAPGMVEPFLDDRGAPRLSQRLVSRWARAALPMNARELEREVFRAIEASHGDRLDLPDDEERSDGLAQVDFPEPPEPQREDDDPAISPAAIREAVIASSGNLAAAARALGLPSRYGLYRLLRAHGISAQDVRGHEDRESG